MGEITREKLAVLRDCDAIYLEELERAGLADEIWQSFAVLTGARTVGVMGDGRTYGNCVALRAVTTEDAMTVEAAEIPYPVLKKIASRIIAEVQDVNRVAVSYTHLRGAARSKPSKARSIASEPCERREATMPHCGMLSASAD